MQRMASAFEQKPEIALNEAFAGGCLSWWPELGLGWFPVAQGLAPYDQGYFDRFARQADSDIGRRLMTARCDFVARHWRGSVVDIGIGSGAFLDAMLARGLLSFGYDVNPAGVAWLEERHLFCDPYKRGKVPAICLWDVIEHIADFRPLLATVTDFVFVALPIFDDAEHVLRSKHFRRDEHCWYFTRKAFVSIIQSLGFELVEHNDEETIIGREGIESFAFRRVKA